MLNKITLILILLTVCASSNNLENNELREMRKFVGNGVLSRAAEVLRENQEYSLTRCALDILHWARSLNKVWAWQMLDANGKFPPGFLGGNFYSFGQFDECLSITPERTKRKFKGKYCQIEYVLTNFISLTQGLFPNSTTIGSIPNLDFLGDISITLGTCIPDSCKLDEIKRLIDVNLQHENITITKPIVRFNEAMCSTKNDKEFTKADTIAVTILGLIMFAAAFSTLYDILGVFCYKVQNKNTTYEILSSFSAYTNTIKLFTPNKSPDAIKCLNGIRVLSMFWVILGHRYGTSASQPLQNSLEFLNWIKTYSAYAVISSPIAVDTFFVLSGLLLPYVFFNQNKSKKSFNLGLFYLHRFVRIWPAMAALIMFMSSLYYHLGSGPMWPREYYHIKNCAESWWSGLLFVQNYVHPNIMCAGHSWYLAIDTQIYLLSPILIYPLLRSAKFGIINLAFWVIVSQVTCITIVYLNNWGAVLESNPDYWSGFYYNTYMRANVWLIGFTMGYFLFCFKNVQFKINKYVVLVCWVLSLAMIGAVIFGVKPMLQIDHQINHAQDSTYIAFSKSGWAISICWIVFACVKGYGGPVNWLLSIHYFEVFGKLSFSMYLVHLMLGNFFSASSRIVRNFHHIDIISIYFGDLVLTVAVAYIWFLLFEMPFLNIERALTRKSKPVTITPKDINSTDDKIFNANL